MRHACATPHPSSSGPGTGPTRCNSFTPMTSRASSPTPSTTRTGAGAVGLAADSPPLRQVAALLGKPYFERAGEVDPELDTARLSALGFHPAWSASDCVRDFATANRAHIVVRGRQIRLPWRYPWVRVPTRAPALRYPASDARGEFDTDVDPRWPAYTAVNTTEAFPGPMTPLSLELSLDGMRAMGVHAVEAMSVDGELRRAVIEEQTGAFGHRIYANLTVLFAAGAVLPAAGPAGWRDKLFGADHDDDGSETARAGQWAKARRLPRLLVFVASSGTETKRMDVDARAGSAVPRIMPAGPTWRPRDELRCLHDEVVDAWGTAALITLALGVVHRRSRDPGPPLTVHRILRRDGEIGERGSDHGHPCAGRRCRLGPRDRGRPQGTPNRAGHRTAEDAAPGVRCTARCRGRRMGTPGTGESELANLVFADDPAVLLEVVGKLAGAAQHRVPEPAMSPGAVADLGRGVVPAVQGTRPRRRDPPHPRISTRCPRTGRAAGGAGRHRRPRRRVLPRARRTAVASAGRPVPGVAPAGRTGASSERERPPLDFVGTWTPSPETVPEIGCGEALSGIPASVGSVTGRVRVVTVESLHQLSPGEILVADSIDVGWTPYFTYAAAVVLSTGATMSHAAIIAREFGIPCVVGSKTASRVAAHRPHRRSRRGGRTHCAGGLSVRPPRGLVPTTRPGGRPGSPPASPHRRS